MVGAYENFESKAFTPSRVESPALAVSNAEMSAFYSSSRGNMSVTDREQALFGNGFSFGDVSNLYGSDEVIAQGFNLPNPKEWFKTEVEHKYRGKEQATMDEQIPAKNWVDAYSAFPELAQLGEKNATKLMKAIIANELEHYDPLDLGEDAAAKTGHGGAFHSRSVGFAQITADGIRDMARQLDAQLEHHERAANPLERFKNLNNDQLTKALVNPANAPLLIAAHIALDLKTLNRHQNEFAATPETLGYFYNADRAYAKSDKAHAHLLTKEEAQAKQIPNDIAWPTEYVLQHSEHAANIRRWLEKVH